MGQSGMGLGAWEGARELALEPSMRFQPDEPVPIDQLFQGYEVGLFFPFSFRMKNHLALLNPLKFPIRVEFERQLGF